MASGEEDMVWLFDSVTQFLKGPDWAVPVWDFIDENCIIFDAEDENKLVYHDTFNLFREMVEGLLNMHLADMGCSMEQFAELCGAYGTTDVGKEVLEQILAVDDFLSFKKMMVKRNMELELESLRALQALSDSVEAGDQEVPVDADQPEDDEDMELKVALAASLQEAQAAGISTAVDMGEVDRKQEEQEEADLQMALAMSMALEEEQQKMVEEERPPPVDPRPPPVAPPPAAPPALPPVAAPAAAAPRGGPLGALPSIPGRVGGPPAERTATQQAAAELAQRVQNEAAQVREASERERKERAEAAAQNSGVNAAEVRARAEHLKKQRDLILAKRKKQREADSAAAAPPPPPPAGAGAKAPMPPSSTLSAGAGYSSGEPMADAQRARLSVALASSMKASLLGEDGASIDLHQRIENHHRKIDLEMTKAQLRAEAERDRDMGR